MKTLINSINKLMPLKSLKIIKPLLVNYNSNDWVKYKKETEYYDKYIIYQDKNYEMILISWNKNVITPIHNHPKNGCILKVLDGTLNETFYYDNKIISSVLNKNDIGYRNCGEIHTIKAYENSYSLHIYSPPNFYN
jgi:predicted metal-dependent enzyme (double-stranded beta helix superfamily)